MKFIKIQSILLASVLNVGLLGSAVAEVTDDFSGNLSKWTDKGNNEWSSRNGILNVQYDISCGSVGCPQADLILKDQYQMSDNYDASIDMIRTESPTHSLYFQAYASFSLWKDNFQKISVNVGGGGDSWNGTQTQIKVNVQTWDGAWSTSLDENISYNWDPNTWNTVTVKKAGAIYSIYINGTYLTKYEDNFLNGTGKIGLHSYGTKRLDNFVLKSSNSTSSCASPKAVTVSENLDIQIPSLNYTSLLGTQNLWVNLKYYGKSPNGEILWKLKDFGTNP